MSLKPEKMIKLAKLAQASGLQLEINGVRGEVIVVEDGLIELKVPTNELFWFEPAAIRHIRLALD